MMRTAAIMLLLLAPAGCLTPAWHQANREYAAGVRELNFDAGRSTAYYQGVTRQYAPAGHYHYALPDLLAAPAGFPRPAHLFLPVNPGARGPNALALLLEDSRLEFARENEVPLTLVIVDHFSGRTLPAAAPAAGGENGEGGAETAGEDHPRRVHLYNAGAPPPPGADDPLPPETFVTANPQAVWATYRLPNGQAVAVDCRLELRWHVRSRFTYFWRQAAFAAIVPLDLAGMIALAIVGG